MQLSASTTPANVRGLIYSKTAGELFWDRVLNRDYRYSVNLNGDDLGSTIGTSVFFESLLPDTENSVTLRAFDGNAPVSEAVFILLDTRGDDFPYAAGISVNNPSQLPSPPQRPRLVTYSRTAAELFWDAPLANQNIVSTEVTRDGVLIATVPGNSFYDDMRDPEALYVYGLVAVNGDGSRSEVATLNGSPFEGEPSVAISRILTGVSDIVGDNPHQQYFPFLRAFTLDEPPADIEFLESTVVNDSTTNLVIRTKFACNDGTFTLETIPSRFGIFRLFFNACDADEITINGSLSITNTDIGGYNANYQQLEITRGETMVVVDGTVVRTIGRAINFMTESYEPLEFSVSSAMVPPTMRVVLQQTLLDNLLVDRRSTFTTEFTVQADWTADVPLSVYTVQEFQDANLGNGNYLTGSLVVESPDGQTLTLDADTGDASRYNATLATEDAIIGIVGNWDDSIRLPCLSVTSGDEAIPGCRGL